MLTFNDGYHITHHVSSITHWSEMPLHFIRHLDAYEQGGAIIFNEIAFDDITFNVFAGDAGLRRLAKQVIQIVPKGSLSPSLRSACNPSSTPLSRRRSS